MWKIATTIEFAIESKSITQKFAFDGIAHLSKNLTNVSFKIKFVNALKK